jgi:sporulation protein YlmC with PRC-barrel domain
MIDAPDPLRINFHLVDRQIVDTHGDPVGKVDDVELAVDPDTGRIRVTNIVCGMHILGDRIGGRFGGWMAAIARRLHPDDDPRPMRIDVRTVTEIGSAVMIGVARETLLTPPLEQWLDDHLIDKIPGAGDAGQ